MTQKQQTVFLKAYWSGKLFVSKQFTSDQISIGSGEGPSLVLSSPSVSYWHALIEQRLGAYYISDLGSPTGTFVNSKPVLESIINHGDQITIGDFLIHFYVGVPFVRKSVPRQPAKTSPVPKDMQVSPRSTKTNVPSEPLPKSPVFDENKDDFSEPYSSTEDTSSSEHPSSLFTVPTINEIPDQFTVPSPPQAPSSEEDAGASSVPGRSSAKPSHPIPQDVDRKSSPPSPQEDIPSFAPRGFPQKKPKFPISGSPDKTNIGQNATPHASPPSPPPFPPTEEVGGVQPLDKEEVIPPFQKPASHPESIQPQKRSTSPSQWKQSHPPVSSDQEAAMSSSVPQPVKPLSGVQNNLLKKRATDYELRNRQRTAKKEESESVNLEEGSSAGSIIEVVVAWKNRVLSVSHFNELGKVVTFGSSAKADITLPNLIGTNSYSLLEIGRQVFVYVSSSIKARLIEKKKEYSFQDLKDKYRVVTRDSRSAIVLAQNQLVRLDFTPTVRVYIRYTNPVQKAALASVFDFNFSEMVGIMMSFVFLSGLMFYVYLFSPQFLGTDNKWEEEELQKATIEFKQKPRRVKLQLVQKTRQRKRVQSIPIKAKKTSIKKAGVKKPGKMGRLGQVAPKPKEKSKKQTITSARSGGSVKTGKTGAAAKSPRPDPTKVGLLGVFGKKGTQTELDKAYSGTGELAGLAEEVTGYAGQKEAYQGEGIGTRFKNVGAGGKGTNIIGVSGGIKTKGRGGGTRGYGAGGSLGQRGNVELRLGTDDWEVDGGIDKEAIRRVIRRHKAQLESCYEYALQKTPDLNGKVLLQWEIVNTKAKRVKVRRNSTGDRVLARCLMSKLREWDFIGTGLQRGQVGVVNFPFAFQRK